MVAFIKKILAFFILSAIVIGATIFIPNTITRNKASFKIKNNIQYVVFGHSHSAYAYNDSIINNFKNLSDAGESYFYTYQKVKQIVPNNSQVKTIFIEFTNNQIDILMDDWIWGYKKMSYFLPVYAPFISQDDFELLFEKNSKDLAACYSIATKKNLYRNVNRDFNFINSIDGFKWTDDNEIDQMLEKAKSETKEYDDENYAISTTNLEYLRKIIDFCKTHNKNVYLVRSPQNKALLDLNNEKYYQSIKNVKFNDVELLDFNTFTLPNASYRDLDHLNHKGSTSFSIFFNELLNSNLLKSNNKKSIIKQKLKAVN